VLLDEQLSVDLRTGRMDHQRDIVQRALGQSFGGEVLQPSKFYMAMCGEVSKVGSTIFESIQKIANSTELPGDEESVDELLRFFDLKFNPIVEGIREGLGTNFAKLRANPSPTERFNAHADGVRQSEKLKIKLLMTKIMKDDSSRTKPPTFTFQNSPVAVLQVGDRNVASTGTISIGAVEKDKIKQAMRAIGDRLDKIESLSSIQKTELQEVASETEVELSKPTSNWTRVRGLLSVVVSTIEKITALKDVYELLLPLLPAVGIHHVM
jgi:hypothetical protein